MRPRRKIITGSIKFDDFMDTLSISSPTANILLKKLNASKESKVYSPVSMLHALSMIYVGSNNNTAKEIADIIGKDKTRDEIIEYYSQLIKRYKIKDKDMTKVNTRKRSKPSEEEEMAKIIVANKLFVPIDSPLLPEYQKIIEKDFNAELEELNFEDNVTAAKEINSFVYNATNGMIKEIITSDDIESSMVAAVINAVYFQGFWEKPFKNRKKQKFYSHPIRQIDMMTTSPDHEDWNFRVGNGWTALGIPYKTRKIWIFIVLPEKKDGLKELLEKMDFELFKDATTRQRSGKLGVTIPVIETTTELELPEYFAKFGIIDAFNDNCDLTNMFESGKHKIGKAIHKAVIKVDESGTVASAATAFFPQAQSSPGFFDANHPFLYFILTTESSESIIPQDILFIGTFC